MIGKAITAAALVMLALPREPDLGLGPPPPLAIAGVAQLRETLMHKLEAARLDIEKHRAAQPRQAWLWR
jgi:hypothetical protein